MGHQDEATFDGHEYLGSIAVMNGVALIGVRKDVRAAIGKDVGDTVKVVVRPDTAPRTVTVPPELARALSDVGLDARFASQSYTARREAVELVAVARKPETRQRRIEKIIASLA